MLSRPTTPEALAESLCQATNERRSVVPWAAGTRQHLGAAPPPEALRLDLTGLNTIVDYVPEDLTVTLQAGVAIGAVQELLATRNQWLPWDPPGGPQASVGGLLATAASGSLRLGMGTPRDWLLGMQVALADGRLARSGGRVVKNVAGYDLHKLHLGALGTLGVIAEVTLKVMPLPEQRGTLLCGFTTENAALAAAESLRARPLAPLALALLNQAAAARVSLPTDTDAAYTLLACFAGPPASVVRQFELAGGRAREQGCHKLDSTTKMSTIGWPLNALFIPDGSDMALLRLGCAPSALPTALRTLSHFVTTSEMLALPGVGLAWLRCPLADPEDLSALRSALALLQAYLVVEVCPPPLQGLLDLWGPPPPGIELMRHLKQQWDPAGILNAGRYLV